MIACVCEICGALTPCGESLCAGCFLDTLEDDVGKNLYLGGRFYGESLLKGDSEAQVSADR